MAVAAAAAAVAQRGGRAPKSGAAAAPAAPARRRPWPRLTPGERRDSDAVAGLVRENLRVWAQVLELAAGATRGDGRGARVCETCA